MIIIDKIDEKIYQIKQPVDHKTPSNQTRKDAQYRRNGFFQRVLSALFNQDGKRQSGEMNNIFHRDFPEWLISLIKFR